ncbi:MAG: LacI family DNA-binding transcriptional regulator [Oscillochloridaceae bacterium umkhey_bin13]
MPTIAEIARLARVSPATVSKVLNNRPYVSSATRARIEQVIAETGFVPSQWARLLSQRRSHILGLVIPYTSDQLFADPHLLEVMRGIEAAANEHEYNLLLSTARAPVEAASAATRLLRSDVIDGAVVVETLDLRAFAATLGTQPAPWVVIGYAPSHEVPAVHADDYGGALAAMRYLIEHGHRRIGVIGSSPRPYALDERMRGLRDALSEAGLTLDEALLATGDFSIDSGAQAGHNLLERPNPPTAIFALNDRMAIGVVRAAHTRGLGVPNDLSVIGFDDIPPAAMLTPPLTTVRQSGYQLGLTAATLLFELLDGASAATTTIIPTELIIRGSVGAPRS